MQPFHVLLAVIAGFGLSGCLGSAPAKHDTRATDASSSPADAAIQYDRLTGAVDEEEFKTLHRLPDVDAPASRGTLVDLDGTRAYLSLPEGVVGPLSGIVVVHEWWGLNGHIQHWADRLASEGYAALAVDLYGGVVAADAEQAKEAMKAVDDAQALRTMRSALTFLRTDPRVQATRTASIGWCFGGMQSLRLALASPELDACVVYYGSPITEPTELAAMHAELLGIFGTRDKSIPPERVKQFEQALSAAGRKFTIQSFDAEHAFANPSNGRYDEGSAAAAWAVVRAFLARRLKD